MASRGSLSTLLLARVHDAWRSAADSTREDLLKRHLRTGLLSPRARVRVCVCICTWLWGRSSHLSQGEDTRALIGRGLYFLKYTQSLLARPPTYRPK